MIFSAVPVFQIPSRLGEGCFWDAKRKILSWVDILKGEIHRFDPVTGKDTFIETHGSVGFAAPCADGRLIAGIEREVCLVDFDANTITPVAAIDADKPKNRFNDGKCGPDGRLWAGTMSKALNESHDDPRADGSFFRIDADYSVTKMFANVFISNGLAFSPDKSTLYYIDTMPQKVFAFDYDLDAGTLSNKRAVIELPKSLGNPDGMTIDTEGCLWVARWGGFGLSRYDPKTGVELARVDVPVENVTCCAFGGEALDTLYITTSGSGADFERYPLSGSIFSVKPGVCGLPVDEFK